MCESVCVYEIYIIMCFSVSVFQCFGVPAHFAELW
jgi:hypothetical protein